MSSKKTLFPAEQIAVLSGREVIGDALLKLPFLRALRAAWPKARIHWVTTQGPTAYNGPLRETVRPLIDAIHEQPEWLTHRTEDRPSFDLVLDTRGRWKLALQAKWHLPHKLFIAPAFRYLFSDRRPPLFTPRPAHMVDRLLQMAELAAGYAPPVTGRLPVHPDRLAKARQILPEGHIYVGFAPGAGNAIKKWPLASFEKVAKLQVRMNRIPVFLLGPQELDLYDDLFRAIPEAIFPLQAHQIWNTPEPDIEATLAVAQGLTLAVANDSGTSHMLAAVDCPLISLFGPTSATKLAPKVTHGHVLTARDFGSEEMASIPPESVHEAINSVILLLGKL